MSIKADDYWPLSSSAREGLIHDGTNDGYPFFSRDWLDIDCGTISCINNESKKCIIPSLAKIDDSGRCTGFKSSPEIINDKDYRNPIQDLEL